MELLLARILWLVVPSAIKDLLYVICLLLMMFAELSVWNKKEDKIVRLGNFSGSLSSFPIPTRSSLCLFVLTEHFATLEPQNPSINVSLPHNFLRSQRLWHVFGRDVLKNWGKFWKKRKGSCATILSGSKLRWKRYFRKVTDRPFS